MKINDVLSLLERKVPLNLSDAACKTLGAYDNSGFIIDGGAAETDCVVFALDLTAGALRLAKDCGAKLIITHHPAIYRPIKSVRGVYTDCIASSVSVYSTHLSLDTACGGIEDGLARAIGAEQTKILEPTAEGYGFGRYFEITAQTFNSVIEKLNCSFATDKMLAFGDENRQISKVASFCGAGLDEAAIENAGDADLLVSADISHHVLLAALEKGKCVLQLTHYASEVFAMKAFCEAFCKENDINHKFYIDERFL